MSRIIIRLFVEKDADPWDDNEKPEEQRAADVVPFHTTPTLAVLQGVFEDALNLAHAKDQGYQGAWRSQGYMGNLARILSKASRLRALLWGDRDAAAEPAKGSGEAITDTLLDQVNLSAFMLANMAEENRWGR